MDHEESIEQQELYEHFHFEVDKGQSPVRIDKYLFNHIENVSRNKIQNAARHTAKMNERMGGTALVNQTRLREVRFTIGFLLINFRIAERVV